MLIIERYFARSGIMREDISLDRATRSVTNAGTSSRRELMAISRPTGPNDVRNWRKRVMKLVYKLEFSRILCIRRRRKSNHAR